MDGDARKQAFLVPFGPMALPGVLLYHFDLPPPEDSML